jgi:hypothetical protein
MFRTGRARGSRVRLALRREQQRSERGRHFLVRARGGRTARACTSSRDITRRVTCACATSKWARSMYGSRSLPSPTSSTAPVHRGSLRARRSGAKASPPRAYRRLREPCFACRPRRWTRGQSRPHPAAEAHRNETEANAAPDRQCRRALAVALGLEPPVGCAGAASCALRELQERGRCRVRLLLLVQSGAPRGLHARRPHPGDCDSGGPVASRASWHTAQMHGKR